MNGQKFEPILAIVGQPGSIAMIINMQGTPDNTRGNLQSNLNSSSTDIRNLRLDTWYQVEAQLVMNSAYDRADGVFRLWLSGTQVMEYTDIRYMRDAWTRWIWGNVHIAPTWGGQGGTLTRTWYWYLDNMYISGR